MYHVHMDIAQMIGGAVSRTLEQRGMTVKDLSLATDIPYSTLRRRVLGIDEFGFSELARVGDALGVRPSSFIPPQFQEQVAS